MFLVDYDHICIIVTSWIMQMFETGTPDPSEKTHKNLGFFLTPGFSPLGFFSALEVLRTANRLLGEFYYSWKAISLDGLPVESANGVAVVADISLATEINFDTLFVCAGFHPETHCDETTLAWIRKLYRHGTHVGAISTGTYMLAKAGVIGERRCTIHGDNAASLREDYPKIDLVDGIFEIDRNLFTCTGGTSAIDLFIHLASAELGKQFAAAIAYQIQQDRVRNSNEVQSRMKQIELSWKSKKLVDTLNIMEDNIETPLTSHELASQIGVSPRQLQRLFKMHTGRTPKDHYLSLRLNHGRQLLLQTNMPVFEVAIASGFISHAHFTKCYRMEFGYTPRMERT